jgi:hypothetical protein
MRRNTNQNQSRFSRITDWLAHNRIKGPALAFALLLVVGLATGGIIKLTSRGQIQSATTQQDAESAERIPGWWYQEHFGASTCEQDACRLESDPDVDKLTNAQEYFYSSNPMKQDTNGNGNTDGQDVAFGYAPSKPGKVTFDEAGSDDSIVGESLLFNDEIKDVIVNMTDLSKSAMPEVNEAELVITDNNTQDGFIDYMLKMDEISKKFHAAGQYAGLSEQIKMQNPTVIGNLKLSAIQIANEYKKVPVPSDALQLHKYQIGLWSLVPSVIETPTGVDSINSLYEEGINRWFDSVQSMIAINQKIYVEIVKLRTKYEFTKP